MVESQTFDPEPNKAKACSLGSVPQLLQPQRGFAAVRSVGMSVQAVWRFGSLKGGHEDQRGFCATVPVGS